MRRIAIITVAALALLSLTGWVVVGLSGRTIGHVQDAARAAAALAAAGGYEAGVERASASYSPLDAGGESLQVAVTMRRSASIAEWRSVTDLVGRRVTRGALQDVRSTVRISGAGAGGGDLQFETSADWPAAEVLHDRFDRWQRIEEASGVSLRITHSAKSGELFGFFVTSPDDSRRFIAALPRVDPQLTGLFVDGYGFQASGPAPKGAAAVYRALLRSHDPAAPLPNGLPQRPTGTVAWGKDILSVALAAPATQQAPSRADALVVAALDRTAGTANRSASWTNGHAVASVGLTRCPTGKRIATATDRAFVAEIAASGRPLHEPAEGGVCGS